MDEETNPLSYPWVQETLETVMEATRSNVLNWCGVVIKMGMDEDSQKQWTTIFKEQVTELYGDMMQDVTAHQNRLFVEIETLLEKSASLCKDLHIKMPGYGSKGLSLYEEQRLLKERIKKYERLVEEKRAEVAELNKQQLEFCLALGRTPKTISESPLPTPEFIQEFKQYLETLESEKFTREEKFLDVKGQITEIVAELSYTPTLDFEKAVISPDDSLFLVTDENMKKLDNFYNSLKQQLDDTKEEIAALREKIKSFWELLAEDLRNYDAFSQKTKGNSLTILELLKQEVKRCEDLKKANIEAFVKRLRAELVNLWDKCHLNDKERDFEFFNTDLYSEDLLTLHDMEIQKLKKYYNENRDLFILLEKREELWAKWQTLEQRATDRNRYNNRGGQLLKEEKERNALAKRIPEIQNQLLVLARDFEKRTRKPFLSWGESVESIIFSAQEKHDQERKLKLSARKQQREKTLTPGKSTFLTPCTSTQNLAAFGRSATSAKRKPVTPLFPAKRMRVLGEYNQNVPQTAPPKVTVNGKLLGPSRYSLERAKRIAKCRRISRQMMQKRQKENAADCSAEYDMFEKEIQNKESCRSTIFLDTCSSNTPLALPLPTTPRQAPAATIGTPRRTPGASTSKSRTPRTGTKLTTAPSLKLLF